MVSENQSDNVWKAVTSGITAALIVIMVIVIIVFIYQLMPILEKHPEISYWFRVFGVIFLGVGSIAFAILLVIGIAVAFRLLESSNLKINFLLYSLWSIPAGVLLLILSKYLPSLP